jgi:hypothetical protein
MVVPADVGKVVVDANGEQWRVAPNGALVPVPRPRPTLQTVKPKEPPSASLSVGQILKQLGSMTLASNPFTGPPLLAYNLATKGGAVYQTARAGGENVAGSLALSVLVPVADMTGVSNLDLAINGTDPLTLQTLTTTERIVAGVAAGVQLATTGFMIYGGAGAIAGPKPPLVPGAARPGVPGTGQTWVWGNKGGPIGPGNPPGTGPLTPIYIRPGAGQVGFKPVGELGHVSNGGLLSGLLLNGALGNIMASAPTSGEPPKSAAAEDIAALTGTAQDVARLLQSILAAGKDPSLGMGQRVAMGEEIIRLRQKLRELNQQLEDLGAPPVPEDWHP